MKRFLQNPWMRLAAGCVWLITVIVVVQVPLLLLPLDNPWVNLAGAVVLALAALAAYYAFGRVWERRKPVAELAPAPAPRELALGVLWGAGLLTATMVILLLLGLYRVTGMQAWTAMLPVLSLSIVSGVLEELIIRAVIFRLVQEALGTWLALLLSALLFGALHLANPNASLVAALSIAIEAGVLLGLAYQATGRVWLPIGLHFAWNFTQGGVFGVPISGIATGGLLVSAPQGPAWLSGGTFGAEASIFAVGVCLAGAAYFWWRVRREGKVVAAPWQTRAA